MKDILPCPFCGSKTISLRQFDMEDREGIPVQPFCEDCGASGPWLYLPSIEWHIDLIKEWNRREWNKGQSITTISIPQEEVANYRTCQDLLYRMARHIRNTDSIDALKWGVQGMRLLEELYELDVEKYKREVK